MRTITVEGNTILFGGDPVGKLTLHPGELRDDVIATLTAPVGVVLESSNDIGDCLPDAVDGTQDSIPVGAYEDQGDALDSENVITGGFPEAPSLADLERESAAHGDESTTPTNGD